MPNPWRLTQSLTILDGETESEEIDLRGNGKKNPMIISIGAPAILPETVNPQWGSEPGGTFVKQRSNGVVIALAADCGDTIGPIIAGSFRLKATSAVGGDRVFLCFMEPYPGY